MKLANIVHPMCAVVNGLSFWWEVYKVQGDPFPSLHPRGGWVARMVTVGPVFRWADFEIHAVVRLRIPRFWHP